MHVAAGGLHPIEHRAHDGADLAVPLEFRILYSAITVTCLSLSLSLSLARSYSAQCTPINHARWWHPQLFARAERCGAVRT